MGIFSGMLGNAWNVNKDDVKKELAKVLNENEDINAASTLSMCIFT